MSVPSKIVLGTSCLISMGVIGYVHYQQQSDRERLHDGVIRDIERQQRRKTENLYLLQQQIDFTKEARKIQYGESSGT